MRSSSATILAALLASHASAHFLLHYPPTIRFSDDDEGTAPCGSFTVDFTTDNVTGFHVGGDAIALQSTHPAAVWLFRATLDTTTSGNWTNLLPAISQDDLGAFCEQNVTVPASWAGSRGVINVIQDAADGLLYQCAAINFVAGTATSIPSSCTNMTGLTAAFTTAAALSSIPASGSAAVASSTASSSASASSTHSAATTIQLPKLAWVGPLAWAGLLGCGILGLPAVN